MLSLASKNKLTTESMFEAFLSFISNNNIEKSPYMMPELREKFRETYGRIRQDAKPAFSVTGTIQEILSQQKVLLNDVFSDILATRKFYQDALDEITKYNAFYSKKHLNPLKTPKKFRRRYQNK